MITTVLRLLLFSAFAVSALTAPAALAQPAGTATFDVPEASDSLPGAGPMQSGDWFDNVWEDRRTRFAENAQNQQGAVVFLGDSITQGWGDQLQSAFPDMQLANRGISGDTTRGMLYRLEEDVLSLDPKAVVLLMGTNDIGLGADPETVAGNVELIIERLKQHDDQMPIIFCRVMPSSGERDRPADKIQRVNELVADAVRGDEQVIVLDTYSLYANEEGDAKKEEFPDLLHPNREGYRMWAAALRPIFATLGYVETEPDDFQVEEGFESLFNGHDLTGWGFRPTLPGDLKLRSDWQASDPGAPPWPIITETEWFDGQTVNDTGRFAAINGRLVVKTPTEGRKIEQIWTKREFPNDFILRLEFRATPNADSGIYIRGPQLQCRDYLVAGPFTELEKYKPQDWNQVEVTVKDGVAHCTCNGEVLDDNFQVPPTGPIGLEGDRGQMEYRRIRVRELR